MIKRLIFLWMALSFSVTVSAFAPPPEETEVTCDSIKGQEDFIVILEVLGSRQYQDFYFTNGGGNSRYETLWYNQQPSTPYPDGYPEDFLFLDTELEPNTAYYLKFEYAAAQGNRPGQLYYYKTKVTDNDFQFVSEQEARVQSGNIVGTGGGIVSAQCRNQPVTPPEPEIPDVCDVFPYAAQSWLGATDSTVDFSLGGGSLIIGTKDSLGELGVKNVIRSWNTQRACDGELCVANPVLVVAEPQRYPLVIPDTPSVSNPSTPVQPGSYSAITLANGGSFEFVGGRYEVGAITLSGGATLTIPSGTELIVNQLSFGGGSNLVVSGGGLISIWAEDTVDTPAYVGIATNADVPIKANVFSRSEVVISGAAVLQGAVTANRIRLEGSGKIQDISNSCSTSPPPTVEELELTPTKGINLTCDAALALDFQVLDSNGDPNTSFSGRLDVTFSGSNSYTTSVTQGALDTGTLYTTNGQGLLQIELSDRTVGTVSVVAFIEGSESSTTQNGRYQFVPNKFAISDEVQAIVANKRKDITITAQQCDENGDPVNIPADVYSGDKTLTISGTEYLAPKNDVAVEATIAVADKQNVMQQSQVTLNFSQNGNVTTEVLYPEAGSVSYTLTDQVCIIDENDVEQCEEIVGLQQLDARPWTFAICHDQKSLIGTATSGSNASDALVAAGDTFELLLQPLRYIDGAADPAKIEVKDYCGRPQTQNFFGTDAPFGTVTVQSIEVDTPENGELGAGLQGTLTLSNQERSKLQMDDLYWQDVGSLQVEASGNYLNSIQPGVRSIGRFYPAYLTADDQISKPAEHSQFAYLEQPLQHQFSVYAHARDGQKVKNYHLFGADFVSQIRYVAQTDSNQDLTDRLYDGNNAIELDYTQLDWGQGIDDQTSLLAVNFDDFIFKRSPVNGQSTNPDGPFTASNSDFGLQVSEVVDGATWQNSDQLNGLDDQFVLLQSPYDFRYGRMVLADVGANSGQTTVVPLIVEVWGEDGFATNQDDGSAVTLGSTYNGAYYCTQQIWLEGAASGASLTGDGGVIEGLASEQSNPYSSWLYAGHSDDSIREQQRLWLRLGPQLPLKLNSSDADILCPVANYTYRPWLRYNWRNLGDEDPSTVVTFGTYRGNDRVIYRGEPGLTGN
ncbi:hypothetical protein ST37_03145 [Vibrio sp. qd031]|uniref:DUF6701 domain-containing protein n=1 Tax=Vibrio sp. qd031 TaxID=1603038 RepID=UPI000A10672F|nr:DUF6701 domain-containing protein [Vibrio sp. qd031]ORT52025.1 hypothetical protein ST37_03145 [Vibrio sp. qd031]